MRRINKSDPMEFWALAAILLVAALTLLWFPVDAAEYGTVNYSGAVAIGSGTNYSSIMGSNTYSATNEERVSCVVADAITITGVTLYLNNPPGPGKSRTITIRKNSGSGWTDQFSCTASDTAEDCTMPGTATYAEGDLASVMFTSTGGPSNVKVRWSVAVETTSDNASIYCGSSQAAMSSSSGARYPISGQQTTITTVDFTSELLVGAPGTWDNLFVSLSTTVAGGASRSFELLKNGVSTGTLSCTVSAGASTCSDTSNSFTVVAGDAVTVAETITGTPGTMYFNIGARFTADRAGVVFIADSTPGNVSSSADRWFPSSGAGDQYRTPENANTWQAGRGLMECYEIYFEGNIAAGGFGGSYELTFRSGGVDTDLKCSMPDPATTCNDTGQFIMPTSTDPKLTKESDPIGPGATPQYHGTVVCEVPTRRIW